MLVNNLWSVILGVVIAASLSICLALSLSACASGPLRVSPQLPPPPADAMQPETGDRYCRLGQILGRPSMCMDGTANGSDRS